MTTVGVRPLGLGTIFLLAPIIFIAHFLEEAPGFVAWFNAHVSPQISQQSFWTVNLVGLAITLSVVGAEWFGRSVLTAAAVVAWFSFLMFANALFHITVALSDRAYVPGVVTAVVLYLPFYGWVVNRVVRIGRLTRMGVAAMTIFGAFPMGVHGYLIVFRGSRLF